MNIQLRRRAFTLSQLINRLLPQRAPVRHERLRCPAFRGRPRRHLTTSPPTLAHAAPVTAEITPAAGSCPALLSSRRSVAAHVRRPVSLGLVTLVTHWLLATTSAGVTTRPSNSLHNTITSALRGIARLIRQSQRNDRSPVQHFHRPKKISPEKSQSGGPGPRTRFLLQLPLPLRLATNMLDPSLLG
jgi:hypothetical protein